jgi:hypothetical protein
MFFVAQPPIAVAPLDRQVEAWLLHPLLMLLFLMILIKALLELPLFYIGTVLVVLALTPRKRLAMPVRATSQKANVKVEQTAEKEVEPSGRLLGSMPLVIILVGATAVIFQIIRASPDAAKGAYNAMQELTDPKHDEGDPLSVEQRAIVERYSAIYSKTQSVGLDEDERFVASQIARHKRDRRWLYVESILQHFARAYATKPSQNQISQHFFVLWQQLEQEVKARSDGPSPTPD